MASLAPSSAAPAGPRGGPVTRGGARSRLRTRAQLDCMRREGRREAGAYCLVVATVPPPDGQDRVAFVVSRRYSTKAVVRNRARRLLREAYRQVRPGLRSAWLLLVARQRMQNVRMQDVLNDLRTRCSRLGLLSP